MDQIATNVVGNALAATITEDWQSGGVNKRYEYTGRVFRRPIGTTLYYEMDVYENDRKLLRPTYAYPDETVRYYDTFFNNANLTLVED